MLWQTGLKHCKGEKQGTSKANLVHVTSYWNKENKNLHTEAVAKYGDWAFLPPGCQTSQGSLFSFILCILYKKFLNM